MSTIPTGTMKEFEHIPGEPVPTAYTLFYRHGVNPKCEKGFMHIGDIRSANQRAQVHCKIMGYTFIFVRPLIVDLESEEKQQLNLPGKAGKLEGMTMNT